MPTTVAYGLNGSIRTILGPSPARRHHDSRHLPDHRPPTRLRDRGAVGLPGQRRSRARVHHARAGERDRRAPRQRRAAAVAGGFAAADRAGPLRGGTAPDAPLVRRPGDAPPLHDRRRACVLRRALPAGPLLPGRAGAWRDLLRGVRNRSVPLDLQARAEPVPPRGRADRQRQRQRHPPGRALHRDDRDADAGAVRPAYAGHRRRAPLRDAR